MLNTATETGTAMKQDKVWDKDMSAFYRTRAEREHDQMATIVARQRQNARELDRWMGEHQLEEEELRSETIRQITEAQRRREDETVLSARSAAANQKVQYKKHLEEIQLRQMKQRERDRQADEKAKELKASIDAANKRVAENKKEAAAKFLVTRQEYTQKREAVKDSQAGDSSAQEKKLKEFRRKEQEQARRLADYEAKKQIEVKQRAEENAERMRETNSARAVMLEERHRQNEEHWENMCAATAVRIVSTRSEQQRLAAQHSARVRGRTDDYAEVKRHHDREREEHHVAEVRAGEARISTLNEARSKSERQAEKLNLQEFTVKSKIEEINWNASVKKLDPGSVRALLPK